MSTASSTFKTHVFCINKSGTISMVPNVLHYISHENWRDITGDTKAGYDFLENLWEQARALVAEHTELHQDPLRTSNDPAHQEAYMLKLSAWIAGTGPVRLREMQASLDTFFGPRWEAVFYPHGRAGGMDAMPLPLRMVCWQKRVLRQWFLDFAASKQVARGVNPAGGRAGWYESSRFAGAPAILVFVE